MDPGIPSTKASSKRQLHGLSATKHRKAKEQTIRQRAIADAQSTNKLPAVNDVLAIAPQSSNLIKTVQFSTESLTATAATETLVHASHSTSSSCPTCQPPTHTLSTLSAAVDAILGSATPTTNPIPPSSSTVRFVDTLCSPAKRLRLRTPNNECDPLIDILIPPPVHSPLAVTAPTPTSHEGNHQQPGCTVGINVIPPSPPLIKYVNIPPVCINTINKAALEFFSITNTRPYQAEAIRHLAFTKSQTTLFLIRRTADGKSLEGKDVGIWDENTNGYTVGHTYGFSHPKCSRAKLLYFVVCA